eukprot:scaffold113074_cov57-Phaeocystis_antarctica.AAC.3
MPVALSVPHAQRRPSFDEACSSSARSQPPRSPKNPPLQRRNSWNAGDASPGDSKSPKHRLKVQVCVRLRPEIAELDSGPDLRTPTQGAVQGYPDSSVNPPPSPGLKAADVYDGNRADGRERASQLAVSQRPWLHVSQEAPKKGKGGGAEGGASVPARSNCLAYRGNRFKFKHVFPPSSTQLEVFEAAHAPQARGVRRLTRTRTLP